MPLAPARSVNDTPLAARSAIDMPLAPARCTENFMYMTSGLHLISEVRAWWPLRTVQYVTLTRVFPFPPLSEGDVKTLLFLGQKSLQRAGFWLN